MMVVGLLAALFLIVSAYIALARFDNLTLQSTQQAQAVDQVVQSLTSVVLSAIREAWADGDGNLLAGGREDPNGSVVRKGYLDVDVPGYEGSRFLAGPAPVRDVQLSLPTDGFGQLRCYRQTVSSFDDTEAPRHVRLREFAGQPGLLLEDATDGADAELDPNDVIRNARRPFMDADADGIPDSFFVGTSSLTDIANAVAGKPARAPGGEFDPSAIGDPNSDPLAAMWLRFDGQARYEVAVKVVSNGGMVALASPGDAQSYHVWNRQFVTEMFNWVKHPRDTNRLTYNAWANARFQELAAQAGAVEAFLRNRGGVLATYAEYLGRGVPEVLRLLEDPRYGFFYTFVPTNQWASAQPTLYQRFNLATLDKQGAANEWNLWRFGSGLDPDAFNYWFAGLGEPDPRKYYFPRQHITTISYSDELAREIDPQAPADPNNPDALGIYPGQPKFYLGQIAAAFDQNGYFVEEAGQAIIRRLAKYYYEMLSDYDGWGDDTNVDSDGPVPAPCWSVVSPRQQAMMLAVNTVAFAAPRSPTRPGFIDAVWYTDDASGRTYVGYAPQLFITQAIAYCEGGTDGRIAVAVELFNPNEPDADADPSIRFNNPQDDFALDLTQFALSVHSPGEQPDWHSLSGAIGAQQMTGRNFVTIAIDDGGNTEWHNHSAYIDGFVTATNPVNVYTDAGGRRQLDVSLARMDSQGRFWLVDRLTIGDRASAPIPPPLGSQEPIWVADYYRDAAEEPHFGGDWNGDGVPDAGNLARWRMVVDIHDGEVEDEDPNESIDLGPYAARLNNPAPQASRRAPSVPLCTMNAGAGLMQTAIHGDYRPASFPTVGFLLFVPRFCTVYSPALGRFLPTGEVLRKQWERTIDEGVYDAAGGIYPADFGHMPIFDNHQGARADKAYFGKDRAGRIPWGLLIFDYFTTLNPYADEDGDGQPDLDLWRVPGRINVNTAPWYVLAGLPVLSPTTQVSREASPAFWSRKSGVLVGPVRDPGSFPNLPNNTLHRFDDPNAPGVNPPSRLYVDPANGWYRLGPYLAQAIASYRDRLQYSSPTYNPLWAAYARNEGGFYRKQISGEGEFEGYPYGPIRREGGKYGLLGLGELANVYGFESPVLVHNSTGGAANTLYNPLGRPNNGYQATIQPDFFKAVSLMALLDTHFLTTRSNTFTVYISLMDRDEDRQQSSLRVQMTVDRSNLLPRLLTDASGEPLLQDTNGDGQADSPVIIQSSGPPEVITRLESSYFNTQSD